MPPISYDVSVGINKSKNKQQKHAQPPWHVERASHVQNLQHKQRMQVNNWQHQGHRPQTTRQARVTTTTTNTIPYYFGGIPKIRECLFVLWLWPKQEKLSLFFRWSTQWQQCPSDGQRPRLGARWKACSDTCWGHHQKSVPDFDNWQFGQVWTANKY